MERGRSSRKRLGAMRSVQGESKFVTFPGRFRRADFVEDGRLCRLWSKSSEGFKNSFSCRQEEQTDLSDGLKELSSTRLEDRWFFVSRSLASLVLLKLPRTLLR